MWCYLLNLSDHMPRATWQNGLCPKVSKYQRIKRYTVGLLLSNLSFKHVLPEIYIFLATHLRIHCSYETLKSMTWIKNWYRDIYPKISKSRRHQSPYLHNYWRKHEKTNGRKFTFVFQVSCKDTLRKKLLLKNY